MTCCIVGKHPSIADIDRLIRAQQEAVLAGDSKLSPSYRQIARTYGIRKATLFAHRAVCLTDRSSVAVRSDGVPGRSAEVEDSENASNSVQVDRYADDVSRAGTDDARTPGDGGTGPPDVGDGAVSEGSNGIERTDAARATGERTDVERTGTPPLADGAEVRARAREQGRRAYARVAQSSIEQAAYNLANVTHDIAIRDPNARTHASYVEEVAEIVQSGEWENERTVQRLTRAWEKSKLFVVQCHSDACTLIRVARGSRFEQVESSAARWMNIYNIARKNEDPEAQRVALEALKGHDRVLGLVDTSAKVQINIAQSDEAKLFVSIFLDEARNDPAMLERIRRRMEAARDRLGDPTALLTTGTVVE